MYKRHEAFAKLSTEVSNTANLILVPRGQESRTRLLSRSSLEPLISLDLVSRKLYCFRARIHCICYYCFYIIFSANPVRRPEELRGGPTLARPDFLSMCRVFFSYFQPITFARFNGGKSVNRGLPVLDQRILVLTKRNAASRDENDHI